MVLKDRIQLLLDYKQMNAREFARFIGANTPQTIYDLLSGKTKSLSRPMQESILQNIREVNKAWLVFGEGEMLNSCEASETKQEETKLIPLYDVETAAGTAYAMDYPVPGTPTAMIEIGSFLKDSEFAIRVYGDSMYPNYPSGCIVGLREHHDSFIVPGNVYVIETKSERYLKRVYNNAKNEKVIRCLSDNPAKYDQGQLAGEYLFPEFEIPKAEVLRLFRVTGVIKRETI